MDEMKLLRMIRRTSPGRYIFIVLPLIFTTLPLIYVISTAFKPINEILLFPPTFFVRNPTLNNFSDLMSSLNSTTVPFLRNIFNSLLVSGVTVFTTIIVCSMGAYALSKHKVVFGSFWFALIIAALMFSSHVTTIPSYLVVEKLGLINTYSSLILPKIAVAYNLFLMKQFCDQIPTALLEAVKIDGGGEFYIYTNIVMPQLRPAWATLAVFSFVAIWNDYFSPLIYITDDALKTIPLALQSIGESGSLARAGAVAAATFIMTLPTIFIFASMQKKVISTMAFSGIK